MFISCVIIVDFKFAIYFAHNFNLLTLAMKRDILSIAIYRNTRARTLYLQLPVDVAALQNPYGIPMRCQDIYRSLYVGYTLG